MLHFHFKHTTVNYILVQKQLQYPPPVFAYLACLDERYLGQQKLDMHNRKLISRLYHRMHHEWRRIVLQNDTESKLPYVQGIFSLQIKPETTWDPSIGSCPMKDVLFTYEHEITINARDKVPCASRGEKRIMKTSSAAHLHCTIYHGLMYVLCARLDFRESECIFVVHVNVTFSN